MCQLLTCLSFKKQCMTHCRRKRHPPRPCLATCWETWPKWVLTQRSLQGRLAAIVGSQSTNTEASTLYCPTNRRPAILHNKWGLQPSSLLWMEYNICESGVDADTEVVVLSCRISRVWGAGKQLQRAALPFIGQASLQSNLTTVYGKVRNNSCMNKKARLGKGSFAALVWLACVCRTACNPHNSALLLGAGWNGADMQTALVAPPAMLGPPRAYFASHTVVGCWRKTLCSTPLHQTRASTHSSTHGGLCALLCPRLLLFCATT